MGTFKNQVDLRKPGDMFIGFDDRAYHMISAQIENDAVAGGSATITNLKDLVGLPVIIEGGIPRFATAAELTGGAMDGMVFSKGPAIESLAPDAVTQEEYAIVVRGPGTLNEGNLPANDAYGSAITGSALLAEALLLDPPINSIAVPAETTTQTGDVS